MIQHIFFDLDRTLWDFEKNTKLTLQDIYDHFSIYQIMDSFEDFNTLYHQVNDEFWNAYRKGKIDKEYLIDNRYYEFLKRAGKDDRIMGKEMGDYYIEQSPYQKQLFPDTIEILTSLKTKGFHLHIITNGFQKVQLIKIKYSGLAPYFTTILCSDEVGVNKPNSLIFKTALERAKATPETSIMIGDDLQGDVIGAENVGIKGVLFDPFKKYAGTSEVITIHRLKEIVEKLTTTSLFF